MTGLQGFITQWDKRAFVLTVPRDELTKKKCISKKWGQHEMDFESRALKAGWLVSRSASKRV